LESGTIPVGDSDMSGGEASLVQGFDCLMGIDVVFEKTDEDAGCCLSLCHKYLLFQTGELKRAER
jgi:hypothetical protein